MPILIGLRDVQLRCTLAVAVMRKVSTVSVTQLTRALKKLVPFEAGSPLSTETTEETSDWIEQANRAHLPTPGRRRKVRWEFQSSFECQQGMLPWPRAAVDLP